MHSKSNALFSLFKNLKKLGKDTALFLDGDPFSGEQGKPMLYLPLECPLNQWILATPVASLS